LEVLARVSDNEGSESLAGASGILEGEGFAGVDGSLESAKKAVFRKVWPTPLDFERELLVY